MENGLIGPQTSVFDYGCGHGNDVEALQSLGISVAGWDPAFRPNSAQDSASVVNLGYVINVIENGEERVETIRRAWRLAQQVLIISARLTNEMKDHWAASFADGHLTTTRTFQKYYEQSELRAWIEETLGETPVAAAPGVFYVFRDHDQKESFLASRVRHRPASRGISLTLQRFTEHRRLLEPLIEFVSSRGRLPEGPELGLVSDCVAMFGSVKKAFRLIVRVTGEEQWKATREERAEDLLVYLALTRFGGRPRRKQLPWDLMADVRAFFGTYRRACDAADALLFKAGSREAIQQAIQASPIGKRTPTALYIHRSALGYLPSVLRVYEGCARYLIGEVEGATVIKLFREIPQISYLGYPDFDSDPHPACVGSLLVHLQSFRVSYRDYAESENPSILHRKEEFLSLDDRRREAFVALTKAEEARGLYEETQSIGTRQGWARVLAQKKVKIEGNEVKDEVSAEESFPLLPSSDLH